MIKLIQLSPNDDSKVYEMLQRIKLNENEFKNTAYGLSIDEFRKWLIQQEDWSKGHNLPEGYVPQTIYWLYDDETPVGMGKIRHRLTDDSRRIGGNIGYAVDSLYRNKGYGRILLHELIVQAKQMGIDEILITVEKYNPASRAVAEKNGGIIARENSERWFFEF